MGLRIRLLATDIDGTLTTDRSSEVIPVEAIEFMRRLESRGVLVSLVSANALPVIVGLKRYLGLKGPVIAENGALIFINESYESLTKYSARDVLEEVLRKLGSYVENSWQNNFRLHDYALKVKMKYSDRARYVFKLVKEYVERGELVPDGVIAEMVKDYIVGVKEECTLLLDGFPRTFVQCYILEGLLLKMNTTLNSSVALKLNLAD